MAILNALLLLLVVLAVPIYRYWRWFKYLRRRFKLIDQHEREQRRRAGLCPSCGYDVRATPLRCPECGEERLVPRAPKTAGLNDKLARAPTLNRPGIVVTAG